MEQGHWPPRFIDGVQRPMADGRPISPDNKFVN
jgi:hypothetical protein